MGNTVGTTGSLSTDKYQLLNFIKGKYDYTNTSIFFDTINYGTDFDWTSYLDIINGKTEAPTIAKTDTEEAAKQKSLMQILKEIFSQESVKNEADTDKNGALSADELNKYLNSNNVSGLDGDTTNISLGDLENLLKNKSIELAKTAEEVGNDQGGSPSGPSGGTTPPKTDPKVEQTKLEKLGTELTTLETTLGTDVATLKSLSGATAGSGGLTSDNVQNEKVKEALKAKEDAQKDYNTKAQAVTDLSKGNQELTDAIDAVQTKTEEVNTKKEEEANLTANITLSDTNISRLNSQIDTTSGQITSLEGSKQTVPEATEENKEARQSALRYNSTIQTQINALQQQLAVLKTAKEKEEKNNQDLHTKLTRTQKNINDLNKEIGIAQEKIDKLKNDPKLGNAITEMNTAKAAYDSASDNYVKVKSEEMEKQNKQISEDTTAYDDKFKDYKTEETSSYMASVDAAMKNYESLTDEQKAAFEKADEYIQSLTAEDKKEIEDALGFSISYLPSLIQQCPNIIDEIKKYKTDGKLSTLQSDVTTAINSSSQPTFPTGEGVTTKNIIDYYNAQKAVLKDGDDVYNLALMFAVNKKVNPDSSEVANLGSTINDFNVLSATTTTTTEDEFAKIYSSDTCQNIIDATDTCSAIYQLFFANGAEPLTEETALTQLREDTSAAMNTNIDTTKKAWDDAVTARRNLSSLATDEEIAAADQAVTDSRSAYYTAQQDLFDLRYIDAALKETQDEAAKKKAEEEAAAKGTDDASTK